MPVKIHPAGNLTSHAPHFKRRPPPTRTRAKWQLSPGAQNCGGNLRLFYLHRSPLERGRGVANSAGRLPRTFRSRCRRAASGSASGRAALQNVSKRTYPNRTDASPWSQRTNFALTRKPFCFCNILLRSYGAGACAANAMTQRIVLSKKNAVNHDPLHQHLQSTPVLLWIIHFWNHFASIITILNIF